MRRLVPIVMGVALLAACGDTAVSQPAAAPAAPAPAVTPAPTIVTTPTTPPSSNAPSLPTSTTVTMAIIDKTGNVQTALGAVEQSALDQALTAITN
jgi:hypothetical protein